MPQIVGEEADVLVDIRHAYFDFTGGRWARASFRRPSSRSEVVTDSTATGTDGSRGSDDVTNNAAFVPVTYQYT